MPRRGAATRTKKQNKQRQQPLLPAAALGRAAKSILPYKPQTVKLSKTVLPKEGSEGKLTSLGVTLHILSAPYSSIQQLINVAEKGQKVPLGATGMLVLTKMIKSGAYGAAFLGYYKHTPSEQVVIKLQLNPCAMVSSTGAVQQDSEHLQELDSGLREYDLMSRVLCGEEGLTICPYGAFALLLNNGQVHFAFVIERMDGDLPHFVKEYDSQTSSTEDRFGMVMLIVLTMLKRLRQLHKQGIYHMDAHDGNFLVKSKGRQWNPRLSVSDFGRSCLVKTSLGARDPYLCSEISRVRAQDPYWRTFKFIDVVEYVQFAAGFLGLLEPYAKAMQKYSPATFNVFTAMPK